MSTYIQLNLNIYNWTEQSIAACENDDNYKMRQKLGHFLVRNAENEGLEEVFGEIKDFMDPMFTNGVYTLEERKKVCPTLANMSAEEVCPRITGCTWILNEKELLEDEEDDDDTQVHQPEYSLQGTILVQLPLPKGVTTSDFQRDFHNAFNEWSNHCVEWGWLDLGYCMGATSLMKKSK